MGWGFTFEDGDPPPWECSSQDMPRAIADWIAAAHPERPFRKENFREEHPPEDETLNPEMERAVRDLIKKMKEGGA